jgi:hypothetical protein
MVFLVCSRVQQKGVGETILSVMFEYPNILLVGCWRFQPPRVAARKVRLPRLENAGSIITARPVQTGAASVVACGVA